MTTLLNAPPYAERDDTTFVAEMNALSARQLQGCAAYARAWPHWAADTALDQLPYLHVSAFKHHSWKTDIGDRKHLRTLRSSSTSGNGASQIALDEHSGALQAASSAAILRDVVGQHLRPLLVIDSASSLQRRGDVSARIAAAMSLRPLASEIHFTLDTPERADSMRWDRIAALAQQHDSLLVYGFTWILWQAWGQGDMPEATRTALARCKVHFVHSGGWKKLEHARVTREVFDNALLRHTAPGSEVIDYYGLVEQVGVIFPLCSHGYRHVPRWAWAIVRDPWTLDCLADQPGLLQLMNLLAHGAPYHNVLTEDTARLVPGPCPCGRRGQRFELLGRVPKAEVRGCANQ
jgi:hypothetical protein